jgi:hypothetical protein
MWAACLNARSRNASQLAAGFILALAHGLPETARMAHVDSRALALFRVLLPSWRFFTSIEPALRLLCRVASHGSDFGPWRELLTPPPRGPGSLFSNAAGNLHLACHAALEQLESELEAAGPDSRVGELVGYRLVANLVAYRLRERGDLAGSQVRYQFRLRSHERDLVVSEIIEAEL